MIRRSVFTVLTSALVLSAVSFPARANTLTVIPQPVASYTSSTDLISISTLSGNVGSITGSGLTVNFSTPVAVLKTGVIGGWGTWNSPPATESSTPAVLYTNGSNNVVMTFSKPVSIFGFEAQPDLSDTERIEATYYDASDDVLGNLILNVSGNAGARLFAVSSGMNDIAGVDLTDLGPGGSGCAGCDFAIAQVRFATVPEPFSIFLVGLGILALRAARYLRIDRQ